MRKNKTVPRAFWRRIPTIVSARAQPGAITAFRLIGDGAAVLAAFALSLLLYNVVVGLGWLDRPSAQAPAYAALAVGYAALHVLVFFQLGLYRRNATILNLGEVEKTARGMILSAAFLFALMFGLRLGPAFSRLIILSALVITFLMVLGMRRALASAFARLQRRGVIGRRLLIYGAGDTGRLVMKKITQAPHIGLTVVGFLDDYRAIGSEVRCRVSQSDGREFRARVLGRFGDLPRLAAEQGIHELLVAISAIPAEQVARVINVCGDHGIGVGVVPGLGDVRADVLRVEDLSAIPVLRPYNPPSRTLYTIVKRLVDVLVGGALLLISLPLCAVVAVLIKADSAGPVFFFQERIGRAGRRFTLWKFRTMPAKTDPYTRSPDGDDEPGVTRIGAYLRKLGVDELPQLVNVLRGEMSLVGPRPEMPFIVETYSDFERERLRVKPGITGLWQLSADRHRQIEENIEYDLYYVRHRSLLLDILILLETILFTASQALRVVRRGTRDGVRTATVLDTAPGNSDSSVFVAFDQRRLSSDDDQLRGWLSVVQELSSDWPVKLLAAPENTLVFDAILAPGAATASAIHYVPYLKPDNLAPHMRSSGLVITDMDHLVALARQQKVRVIDPRSARFPGNDDPSWRHDMVDMALKELKGRSAFRPTLRGRPERVTADGN